MYVLELGGEDDAFAAREAATAASDVAVLAPGLATASEVTDRVRTLAYTHRAADLVGTCEPDVDAAGALLRQASGKGGGSVRVRAVDVRGQSAVDTQAAERALGQVLVDRGFAVDLESPDHELRALFTADTAALGWLVAESVRDFGDRKPTERPFFQPGSMGPLFARALANLSGARPGATILDPMCGTGGILVEAGLVGARAVGVDVQTRMVQGSRENLAHFLDDGNSRAAGTEGNWIDRKGVERECVEPNAVQPEPWGLARGDARALPVRTGDIDGVVFDAPYGRQSKITGELEDLVEGALSEAARLAARCVVVGDRPWARVASKTGWTTEAAFTRPVHRSLTRHVLVLQR